MSCGRKGFTLVELLVVVVLVGILAAVAMPKYMRSVENGKADSAASTMKMVGMANRMYAIDHGGNYVTGAQIVTQALAACSAVSPFPASDLQNCKYIPQADYSNGAYQIAACGAGTTAVGGTCPLGIGGGSSYVACAKRNNGSGIYASWGYTMDASGVITCYPSGTTACSGATDPPAPVQ